MKKPIRKGKLNLYQFLTETSEGQRMGGEDAGMRLAEDFLAEDFIDLWASVDNSLPSMKRIRSDKVVYTININKKDRQKYFLIDPVYQPENYPMPNITLNDFNGEKKVFSAIKEMISVLKDYNAKRVNILKNGSNQDIEDFLKEESVGVPFSNEEKNRRDKEKSEQFIRKQREAAEKARLQEIEEEKYKQKKAKESMRVWESGRRISSSEPSFKNSPYFIKKNIETSFLEEIGARRGFRYFENNETPFERDMIPLYNIEGELKTFQEITTDNDPKKMLAGGLDSKGVFSTIGKRIDDISPDETINFAEGLSNAYYVNKITNETCVFALNANNIELVIDDFRNKFPNNDFVIAADNDDYKPHAGNPGMRAAISAAIKNNAIVKFPPSNNRMETDWDDLVAHDGIDKAKDQFNSNTNTISFRGLTEEQKELYQQAADLKYSSHQNVWKEVENFLLPDGGDTKPDVFQKRFSLIQSRIPEHAFYQQDSKDKKKFTPLHGNNISDMSFNDIVGNRKNMIRSLDPNSQKFFQNILSDYISKNQNSLNNLLIPESNKIHSVDKLSNEESRDILTQKGRLPKGQSCKMKIKINVDNEFSDSFKVKSLKGYYDDNNIYQARIEEINTKESNYDDISIKGHFSYAIIKESSAKATEDNQSLKDIMKTERNRRVLEDFTITGLKVNGKSVDIERVEFDSHSMRNIKNNILVNKDRDELNIVTKKDPRKWYITEINMDEKIRRKYRKTNSLKPN